MKNKQNNAAWQYIKQIFINIIYQCEKVSLWENVFGGLFGKISPQFQKNVFCEQRKSVRLMESKQPDIL